MKILFCLLILTYSTLAFTKTDLTFYAQYSENKNAFLEISKKVDTKSWGLTAESWALNEDPLLTTDIAHFKKQLTPAKQLLVISSGLHGIEGYVGSALQRWFIENKLMTEHKLDYDVALIHTLNPWGMQNKRRVSSDHIDLNRNFSKDPHLFQQQNADYMKIDSFLNPTAKLKIGFFHRVGFFYDSIRLIISYSLETLRKSILLGQNQQPRGLYYRGQAPTTLQEKIDSLMTINFKNYQKILWIDLHTGYGAKGKLHLLANDSKAPNAAKIQKLFKSTSIDFGDQKNFYKTEGDLISYVSGFSDNTRDISGVVFEYGTLNSQNTLGSIESLRRMVAENQVYQNGAADDESKKQALSLFQDMFFPQDSEWVQKILAGTEKALDDLHVLGSK